MTNPDRDTMGDALLEHADRINAEEQTDWEGIAELRKRVAHGEVKFAEALVELAVLVPETHRDTFDRVAQELSGKG